ncbi:MAG TPA: hypothetical protein VFN67_25155, partial [Polyangiales bacterium]|nr:hypothetical protein [Polyangiales bacterium]
AVGVSPRALYGLLLDPGAGLFPLTPFLWFALPGLWLQLRERSTRAAAITCSALFVLTSLAIASMNNWRGGWTIGPRYLAVCVPFLAFPALQALDRLARRAPLAAAGLALGTAAASLVASGIPGAYYPHLPPELTRPLPQLFSVLIAHNFAPPNLGNCFGVWGTASLVPLFAAGLAALGLCAHAALSGIRGRAITATNSSHAFASAAGANNPRPQVTSDAHAKPGGELVNVPRVLANISAFALLTAAVCLAPLYIRPSKERGVAKAVGFVTGRFQPSGHDRAARLRAQLSAAGENADPNQWRKLEQLYREEGREQEAKRAAKHEL